MALKVLIGMSGGVDSSTAAYLLLGQGYEVIGATLSLFECSNLSAKSCCRREDKKLAKNICERLGIEHVFINAEKDFKNKIIDPFVNEYLNGRTPSPCVICNSLIKFRYLFEKANELGCKYVATGHYARLDREMSFKLLKGADPKKDQSYFLFMLDSEVLGHTIFPLGEMTKEEVRAIAKKAGLPTHSKKESQEVCFVPNDDYVAYLEENYPERLLGRGKFVDKDENVLGFHRGIHAYTIGQRRHLGISLGSRKFVTAINKEKNEIVIGDEGDLYSSNMIVNVGGSPCVDPLIRAAFFKRADTGVSPYKTATRLSVKIRYSHKGAMATLKDIGDKRVEVIFDEPQRAITPGQAAVFYDGDVVIGGGWIE